MNKILTTLPCALLFSYGAVSAETLEESLHIWNLSSTSHITYGITVDTRATAPVAHNNLSVGAQLNSHNNALYGIGHSFGIATEAWNSPYGVAKIHQIGIESSVISRNSENEGAKVGLDVNIKNRRDGAIEPLGGVGSDKYNWKSRAIQISSQRPSPLGESLGWNIGIDFREGSLAGMQGAEPVALDMVKLWRKDFAILRVTDRVNGQVYRLYVDNGEIVLESE